MTDEGKVYHAINFGEDNPNYKPKDDDMPDDRPRDNDQRFCYYTKVTVWDTCQVKEERTLHVATGKVHPWFDLGQSVNPSLTAIFPPSQEAANQANTGGKTAGQGARKRPSSVPPDSDTAKAKQARAQADDKGKKAGVGKGRIPSTHRDKICRPSPRPWHPRCKLSFHP